MVNSTVHSHLLKAHSAGEEVQVEKLISSEEIDKIASAKQQLENPKSLKDFFEHFEEKIPYWKIKLALYLSDN